MSQKIHNFGTDHWIPIKFLHEFPDAVFHGVAMKSLLGAKELWSAKLEYQTWVTGQKGHKFWFNRGIQLKFSHEFPNAVFLGVGMNSLLIEKELS
jgi:hypothetical protein